MESVCELGRDTHSRPKVGVDVATTTAHAFVSTGLRGSGVA